MSEKTILDEVFDWLHKWWHGEPEQTQYEGTSSTDESGETTEIDEGGGTDETQEDTSTEEQDTSVESAKGSLPKDRGVPTD